jgi:hypothetical protein
MVVSEWWWTGKDLVGGGRGPTKGTTPAFVWMDWGQPRKTLISVSGCWDRDFNTGRPEYEARLVGDYL